MDPTAEEMKCPLMLTKSTLSYILLDQPKYVEGKEGWRYYSASMFQSLLPE